VKRVQKYAMFSAWLACLAGAVACSEGSSRGPLPATASAASSAPATPEELLRVMFSALRRGDRAALEELLVSESEYREVILPGSVPPGEAAVKMPESKAEFFTRLHRTKSSYALADLIASVQRDAGELQGIRWEGAPRAYATYTVLPFPTLVAMVGGETREYRPGLLVDLGGRIRVLSYFRDD